MARFGVIPVEPAAINCANGFPPAMQEKLALVFADLQAAGFQPRYRETQRTNARQAWLQGFGRRYDDGRGIVTNVPSKDTQLEPTAAATAAEGGWHFFCLAADIEDARTRESTGKDFYDALRVAADTHGLTSGDDWNRDGVPGEKDPHEGTFHDWPHVQWWDPKMLTAGLGVCDPNAACRALYATGGMAAVWAAVGAA